MQCLLEKKNKKKKNTLAVILVSDFFHSNFIKVNVLDIITNATDRTSVLITGRERNACFFCA